MFCATGTPEAPLEGPPDAMPAATEPVDAAAAAPASEAPAAEVSSQMEARLLGCLVGWRRLVARHQ